MKTNLTKMQRVQRSLGRAAAVLGLAVLGVMAAQAQPNSPVGTLWDCNLSGNRLGLALLSFADDGTLQAYEFMVPKVPSSGSSSGDRGTGTRGDGSGSSSGSAASPTNLFGSEVVNGLWGFDSHGNLIGFWREILQGVCTTNSITITNDQNQFPNLPPGTITNVDTVTCVDITNGVSFTAKVVPGVRLTLNALIGNGRTLYNGRPSIALTDASGSWYGTRSISNLLANEFFSLSPNGSWPNVYDVVGGSANYSYLGTALVSRWNKFAFVAGLDPDSEIVRSTVGSFDKRHIRFNTTGWEQSAGPLKTRVKFNGTRSSAGPPPG